jgi:hypothetical protein
MDETKGLLLLIAEAVKYCKRVERMGKNQDHSKISRSEDC